MSFNSNLSSPNSSQCRIIKGRCTLKTNKRGWNNSRGEGVLFSFDLKDSKDNIRITAFNRQCTAYFDRVNVGQVYLVSGGSVRDDDKKYSKTTSNYKVNLTEESVIEPCEDESNCPPIAYKFRKIDQLRVGDYSDVIALIKSIGDVETVKKQKTQEELLKRELTILDDSNTEIILALWGDTASNFVANEGDVLVGSNLKVSDFRGLALSSTMNSHIEINPQNNRAFQLLGWYIRVKDSLQTKCLTEKFGTGNFRADWRNLNEIHLGNVGDGTFTLQTKAVIFQMGKFRLFAYFASLFGDQCLIVVHILIGWFSAPTLHRKSDLLQRMQDVQQKAGGLGERSVQLPKVSERDRRFQLPPDLVARHPRSHRRS